MPEPQATLPAFLGGGNEHPLIDIPFSVTVDGRQYAGQGISLLEAHVVGLADPALGAEYRSHRMERLHGSPAWACQNQ